MSMSSQKKVSLKDFKEKLEIAASGNNEQIF